MVNNPGKIKYLAFAVLLIGVLLFAELLLRVLGFAPHRPIITTISSQPENALIAHPQYGLALNPGNFQISIQNKLQYQATHLPDSSRSCLQNEIENPIGSIHFYGCSFTYGMGVNDGETFPALLQQQQNKYNIHNYAAPGYGTIHALLQLRQHIAKGKKPGTVILGYTSLQDARNRLTGIQQKYWSQTMGAAIQGAIASANFPYVNIKRNELIIKSKSISEFDAPWTLSAYSSLIYRLETTWSNIYYGFTDKYKLTEMIIQQMYQLCQKHQIDFYVLGLDKSDSLKKMLLFCAENTIPCIDAGIDIFDPTLNLQPIDAHPNAAAHQYYAQKVAQRLPTNFSPSKNNTQE